MSVKYIRANPTRDDTVSAYLVVRSGDVLGRVEKLRLPVVRPYGIYWWVIIWDGKWLLVQTRTAGRDWIVRRSNASVTVDHSVA